MFISLKTSPCLPAHIGLFIKRKRDDLNSSTAELALPRQPDAWASNSPLLLVIRRCSMSHFEFVCSLARKSAGARRLCTASSVLPNTSRL